MGSLAFGIAERLLLYSRLAVIIEKNLHLDDVYRPENFLGMGRILDPGVDGHRSFVEILVQGVEVDECSITQDPWMFAIHDGRLGIDDPEFGSVVQGDDLALSIGSDLQATDGGLGASDRASDGDDSAGRGGRFYVRRITLVLPVVEREHYRPGNDPKEKKIQRAFQCYFHNSS